MLDISNITALLLAQAVISRSDLRWEFANAAAAAALLSIALMAIALFFFRRGTRDLMLIYLSLFCILYAVRLLAHLPSFHSLFDESPVFWSYLGWLISSIIFFPGALYLYRIVGEQLRRFLRWLITARALYAVFEILAAALGVSLAKLGFANNIKVLATLVATVYTDGILEAKNAAHEQFGKSRCKEFLEKQRDIPAAHFANTLLESVAGFSGPNSVRRQEDDITLLVLDFQKETARALAQPEEILGRSGWGFDA